MSEIWDNQYVRTGWQCPVCGKVNAPWMSQCTCDGHMGGVQYSDHTSPISITGHASYTARMCGTCDYADPVVYTSIPPKKRCRITGDYNNEGHICTVITEPKDPDARGAE